jgi:hypothetical protein
MTPDKKLESHTVPLGDSLTVQARGEKRETIQLQEVWKEILSKSQPDSLWVENSIFKRKPSYLKRERLVLENEA